MPTRLTARAILFDMDGTLVDSTPVVERIWNGFAAQHSIDIADLLATSHGVKAIDTIRRYAPQLDADAALAELVAFEMTQNEGIVEIAGAAAFTRQLPAGGFAVVTSATRDLALLRLELVGIETPAVLVGAEDVDNGKPHPEPYLAAAAAMGLSPVDCVVFEDAPAGIRAGLAAGMRVVVVGSAAVDEAPALPRIADYADARIEPVAEGFDIVLG